MITHRTSPAPLLCAAVVLLGCETQVAGAPDAATAEEVRQCMGFDTDLGPTPAWDAGSADRDTSAPPDHLLEVRLLAEASHWVGIVDVAVDQSFLAQDPQRFTCTLPAGNYTKSYVPIATFCPAEWLKKPDPPPSTTVLEGDCKPPSGTCTSTVANFPLTADRYIVFLIVDCCGSQYGSEAVLRAAYPIRGEYTYFGSGDKESWQNVREAIMAAEDSPTKSVNGKPYYKMDFPCK